MPWFQFEGAVTIRRAVTNFSSRLWASYTILYSSCACALTAIEEANLAITRVRQDEADKTNAKRGPYIYIMKLSDEMRA